MPKQNHGWMKKHKPRKKSKKNARRKRPPARVVGQIPTTDEVIRLIEERHP